MGWYHSSQVLVGLMVTILFAHPALPRDIPGSENRQCPSICSGNDRHNWTVCSSVESLSLCDKPVLFDFAIYAPLVALESTVKFRACTATTLTDRETTSSTPHIFERTETHAIEDSSLTSADMAWWSSGNLGNAENIAAAIASIHNILHKVTSSNEETIIFAYTENDFVTVQDSVRSWSKAKCVSTDNSTIVKTLMGLSIPTKSTKSKCSLARHAHSHLHSRSHCKTIKVVSGDSCANLATKCGISGATFQKYNSYDKKLCSTLAAEKPVCCSSGTLPDVRPKPKSSGDDTCADIAASYGLKVTDLDGFNKKTWGWNGCKTILVGQLICLSNGNPPVPAPVSNAVCEPTKPGTKSPPAGIDFVTPNPCPLKACCNIWGSCGTTKEFCTVSKSGTGNPGTSRPVNNKKAPESFKKIAYYESWNLDRSCMHVDDLKASVEDPRGLFEHFRGLSGIKRIAAFGGWSFSVGVDTYATLRQAIKPEHCELFAVEVVNFLKSNNLDGVDFDWEYPGATDLPIPAGSPDDPKLPIGMTLSIAAPALYCRWASDGCPKGGCLRSHVSMTETLNAIAMIAKAGVDARQIVVGVASYGRSFKMTDPKCKGAMCTFVGPQPAAAKGVCTNSSGYISNAEILDIMEEKDLHSVQAWYDEKTDSDYLLGTQWVAYMSKSVKGSRIQKYQALNFGGISNWAIDLEDWWLDMYDVDGTEKEDTDGLDELFDTCDDTFDALEGIPEDLEERCASFYILTVLSSQLSRAAKAYRDVSEGYDEKFGWYAEWVKDGIDEDLFDFMVYSGEGKNYMDCKLNMINNNHKGSGPCTELSHELSGPHTGAHFIEHTLRDEDGFYKALLDKHNIGRDWITFKDFAVNEPCPCEPSSKWLRFFHCSEDYTMYKSFPRRIKDTSKINVPNPKKVVDEAIPNVDELVDLLAWTISKLRMGSLDASYEDPVIAFSMPVFMLEDAIESIKEVKEIGEKEQEAKKKELILKILNIVFSVIPFVGELAAGLGAASFVTRALAIIAEVGEGALSIVDIIDDPLSAPFAILGLLIGPLGVKAKGSRSGFKSAGDVRRALDEGKLKLFSNEFRRKDELVRKIMKKSKSCKLSGTSGTY
ncbi:glycoside hydrolase family 18 protein [Trichoderma barbatum]